MTTSISLVHTVFDSRAIILETWGSTSPQVGTRQRRWRGYPAPTIFVLHRQGARGLGACDAVAARLRRGERGEGVGKGGVTPPLLNLGRDDDEAVGVGPSGPAGNEGQAAVLGWFDPAGVSEAGSD